MRSAARLQGGTLPQRRHPDGPPRSEPKDEGPGWSGRAAGHEAIGQAINTSRGPIVDEPALIEVLRDRRIAGAALDVFDIEPLPADHPFRSLENVLATPHIGYVSHGLYKTFYEDTVSNIRKWLDTH